MDDVGARECSPIDIRLEEERLGRFLPHLILQFAIDHDVERPTAVGALGFEFDDELFSSQAPLHEGRDKSILGSSPVNAFPGAEPQPVRRLVGGDRERPGYVPVLVPHQKEEMTLEFFDNGADPRKRETEGGSEAVHFYGPAVLAGQFPNRKVAHQMMLGRHECKPAREVGRHLGEVRTEVIIGHTGDVLAGSGQEGVGIRIFGSHRRVGIHEHSLPRCK
jgi:hypothetical protein